MKRPLLYIFSILAFSFLMAQVPTVQETPEDTTAALASDTVAVADVPKEPAQPFSFSFIVDYGKPAVSFLSDETRYEGGLNLLFFDHYSIIGEYGFADLHPENGLQNGDYFSEGNYFRVGGGYLNNIGPKSKLGLSVRYGQSSFTDIYYTYQTSSIQNDTEIVNGPRNSEARWVEVVLTSESRLIFDKENPENKINHLFSLGFHIRFRFLSSYDRYPIYDTYAIPGYGRTVNNPNPALNLYLRITPF